MPSSRVAADAKIAGLPYGKNRRSAAVQIYACGLDLLRLNKSLSLQKNLTICGLISVQKTDIISVDISNTYETSKVVNTEISGPPSAKVFNTETSGATVGVDVRGERSSEAGPLGAFS